MARTAFEKLRVYRCSEDLADAVWSMVAEWPLLARDTVGKQLIRAADSIGANIAEGTGRASFGDNRRFARMARGSLYETKHWLRRAFIRKLMNESQISGLRVLVDQLGPSLSAYIKSIGPRDDSHSNAPATDHGLRTTD